MLLVLEIYWNRDKVLKATLGWAKSVLTPLKNPPKMVKPTVILQPLNIIDKPWEDVQILQYRYEKHT